MDETSEKSIDNLGEASAPCLERGCTRIIDLRAGD